MATGQGDRDSHDLCGSNPGLSRPDTNVGRAVAKNMRGCGGSCHLVREGLHEWYWVVIGRGWFSSGAAGHLGGSQILSPKSRPHWSV